MEHEGVTNTKTIDKVLNVTMVPYNSAEAEIASSLGVCEKLHGGVALIFGYSCLQSGRPQK